jgi:hypothetical protein
MFKGLANYIDQVLYKDEYAIAHRSAATYSLLRAKEKERRNSIVCRYQRRDNNRLIYERERRKTPCRLPKPEPEAEY